jgi:hypothetical protein
MRHLKFIVIFLFIVQTAYSQTRLILGINLPRGRSVDFVFKSFSEIKNGKSFGVPGIGYTEVYIYLDTIGFYTPEIKGWELIAYANTPNLEPVAGIIPMNLNEIYLNITMTQGAGSIISARAPLSSDPNNVIADGLIGDGINGGVEWTVTIAYDCGVDNPKGLAEYPSDYYYNDIIIYIRPVYV